MNLKSLYKSKEKIQNTTKKPRLFTIIENYEEGYINHNETLDNLMITKLVRKSSGVQVITVLTSPFPEYTKNNKIKKQNSVVDIIIAYCPKEREIKLNCFVINITYNKNYTKIELKSNEQIDEVRVITYLTVNNQLINVLESGNLTIILKHFM